MNTLITTNNESLLVVERRQNTYFVGELKEDDKGVSAFKISADVQMTDNRGVFQEGLIPFYVELLWK